jgi:hypothetical protein
VRETHAREIFFFLLLAVRAQALKVYIKPHNEIGKEEEEYKGKGELVIIIIRRKSVCVLSRRRQQGEANISVNEELKKFRETLILPSKTNEME